MVKLSQIPFCIQQWSCASFETIFKAPHHFHQELQVILLNVLEIFQLLNATWFILGFLDHIAALAQLPWPTWCNTLGWWTNFPIQSSLDEFEYKFAITSQVLKNVCKNLPWGLRPRTPGTAPPTVSPPAMFTCFQLHCITLFFHHPLPDEHFSYFSSIQFYQLQISIKLKLDGEIVSHFIPQSTMVLCFFWDHCQSSSSLPSRITSNFMKSFRNFSTVECNMIHLGFQITLLL
jgi:hypothetical protein